MSFSRRRVIPVILVFCAAAAVCFFLLRRAPRPLEKIIIGDARQSAFGLLYIAKSKGYFKKEGLEVELKPFHTGRDALAAAVVGTVDLATVFETPVVSHYLKGDRIAVISTLHESDRNTAMIARRDKGINELKDLRGKTIGVTKGTSAEFFAPSLLQSGGVGVEEVKFVDIAPSDAPRLLQTGEVDAVTIWNPYLFQILHTIPTAKLSVFHLNYYLEYSMLAGLRERLDKKVRAVELLLRGLSEAEHFERVHQAEAVDIIASELSADDPGLDIRAISEQQHRVLRLNNVLLAVMGQVAIWFETHGTVNRSSEAIGGLLYPGPLERVSSRSVTLAGRAEEATDE